MSKTTDVQIQALLTAAGKPAPKMTQALSELGKGDMSEGLVTLWEAGRHNGVIKGATITGLVFSAIAGGYILIKNSIADKQVKKELSETQLHVSNDSACREESLADELNPSTTSLEETSDKE